MRHGIDRRLFQTLPVSGEKITCVQYREDNQATREWWERSLNLWGQTHPQIFKLMYMGDWKFVLIAPLRTVRECWAANDGMTAWMHVSGETIPDFCRQEGGCPELWNVEGFRGKRELQIANLAEIEEYIVLPDHKQVTRGPFAEMNLPLVCAR